VLAVSLIFTGVMMFMKGAQHKQRAACWRAIRGLLSLRAGPEVTNEHFEASTTVMRETLSGQGVEAAAQNAEGIDATTCEALVQCAIHAAIQGAVSEAGN
jgi:hypothetical protein